MTVHVHTRIRKNRTRLWDRGISVPSILVLGSFTPYLGLSLDVRWEHLIVYGALLHIAMNGRLAASRSLAAARPILLPWFMLATLVLTSTIRRSTGGANWFASGSVLAILDNFVLPAAVMVVAASYAAGNPTAWRRQVSRTAIAVVALACANAAMILAFDPDEVYAFVRQFWANPESVGPKGTVADRALTGGRYGGIVNQPLEGGLLYSLALMCWSYLFVLQTRRTTWHRLAAVLAGSLLLAGGLSTGSKVFIFGSLLVFWLTVVPRADAQHPRLRRLLRSLAVASVGAVALVVSDAATFNRFFRVLGAVGTDASIVSGGRWQSVGDYAGQFLELTTLFGQGWQGPQDDALLAYMQGGGIIGVTSFAGLVLSLLAVTSERYASRPTTEVILVRALTVLVVASSFGAISLQINRASSIYWIFIGLMVGYKGREVNRDGKHFRLNSAGTVFP